MGSYLFLLLIVVCPVMMFWMMRGMHGGHGGNADSNTQGRSADGGHGQGDVNSPLEELRRQRKQLDREIEEREAEETRTPVGGGWR